MTTHIKIKYCEKSITSKQAKDKIIKPWFLVMNTPETALAGTEGTFTPGAEILEGAKFK